MPEYDNIQGTSPIDHYRTGTDEQGKAWIEVRFKHKHKHRTYRYTEDSCPGDVASMIELAAEGQGLATYIAQEQPDYAARW